MIARGIIYLTISLATWSHLAEGANIVFMHLYISYSHRQAMMPLANALVAKGHSVTYISPIAPKGEDVNPKIKDIVPQELSTFTAAIAKGAFNIENRVNKNEPHMFAVLDQLNIMCCGMFFKSPEVITWLKSNPKVDLIIMDYWPNCALGLAHKFQSKFIFFNTLAMWGSLTEMMGLTPEAGAALMDCSQWKGCKTPQGFTERLKSIFLPALWRYYEWQTNDDLYGILREGLNMSYIPPIHELQERISLVFSTSNYVTEQAKSLPPMFVSVPGMHVRKAKPLPKDILDFIEKGESDGFVYISFGTLVVSTNIPEDVQLAFLNTVKAFPKLKFLWKWDGSLEKFQSPNLLVRTWFPQQDVLGHPKVKAFVTQAGRPSSQESMTNAVPMIVCPVLGDQDYNAQRLEDIGVAIRLEITTLTEDQLKGAVQELVYNPKYKAAAIRQTKLQLDLPMKPIETAVWWTEYVLRHDDLSHLKAPGAALSWYQRYWLDVYGFLLVCVLTVLGSVVFVVTKFMRIFQNFSNGGKIKSKQS